MSPLQNMTDFSGDNSRDISPGISSMSLPGLTNLVACEPNTSKKGGGIRICPIQLDGKPFKLVVGTPDQPLRVPFHVAPFNEDDASTRLNLNLEVVDEQLQELFRIPDDKVLNELVTKTDLFKKPMPKDKLALMFRCSLPPNGKYIPLLRVEIEIGDGARRVRTWDSNGGPDELPSDWKDLKLVARLEVRGCGCLHPCSACH